MSRHFGEVVAAQDILDAYRDGGRPKAFALLTNGDRVAFACWAFLDLRRTNPTLTPEEFVDILPEQLQPTILTTLKDLMGLADFETVVKPKRSPK